MLPSSRTASGHDTGIVASIIQRAQMFTMGIYGDAPVESTENPKSEVKSKVTKNLHTAPEGKSSK